MEDPKKPKNQHHLDDLQKNLYSHSFESDTSPHISYTKPELEVNTQWKHEPLKVVDLQPPVPKAVANPFVKKIFITSLIFFIISAGIALFIFYGGFNIISSHKVDIAFVGPVSVAAGDELSFDVVIENKNRTQLVNGELYIEFPDGTKQALDISQDLLHEKQPVGDVAAKSSARRTIRAVLFGKERSTKEIKVTLEYGVRASNGVFKKEKIYEVGISSTPLTMTVNNPPNVPSGHEITFSVDIESNSNVPLTNLALQAEYPRGFEFKRSTPDVSFDTNVWQIPSLKPGEKKTISITGIAEGEENDERVFRFNVGIADKVDEKKIVTTYLTSQESVIVRRPPLGVRFTIDAVAASQSIAEPGAILDGEIELINNMSIQLIDAQVELVFSGQALNSTSVTGEGALYRLPVQTLYWDKTGNNQLAFLGPGDTATLRFSFSALDEAQLRAVKNGTINASLKAYGTAVGTGQMITSLGTKTVKIQPTLNLIPRLVHSVGPFQNTGPIPPKAEQKTTYTVLWTVTRSSDDMADVEVRGYIPSYVTWLGVTSPSTENITFIPERNEVIWKVGSIPAGTAGQPAREVAFQVEFYPSFSQGGTSPGIVDGISLKARDVFTGRNISRGTYLLTSSLPTDPKYRFEDGVVQR